MNSCHADVAPYNVLGYVVVHSELQCNLNVCNNTEVSCDSNCVIKLHEKRGNFIITRTHVSTRLLYKESVVIFLKPTQKNVCFY